MTLASAILRRLPLPAWPQVRPWVLLALDSCIGAASLTVAYLLRFDGRIPERYLYTLPGFLLLLVGIRALCTIFFRIHRWTFRHSGLADGARVALAGAAGTAVFLTVVFLLRDPGPPRVVVALELLLSTLLMGAMRFSPRLASNYAADWALSRRDDVQRTVIVGAGSAGEMLLRDLRRSSEHGHSVVGFVDDDPMTWELVVGGRPVLGGVDDLPRIAKRHRVSQVFIAIPRLDARTIRRILGLCADLKLRFKILPVSYRYLQGRAITGAMQDLAPEDLLQREPVTFADLASADTVRGRVALVTGAAGSIGSEICRQLVKAGIDTLITVDLNENGLYLMQRGFEREKAETKVITEVADIRDPGRIDSLFKRYRPQDVFHAAAHKHVPLMEIAPCEAIKNNVLGTKNVAEAAAAHDAERFLYISTDKAVRPTSVMGASKRVGEEIVRTMARRSATKFCAVRFGNVLGSSGSVVPIFREQIAAGGPVSVTHEEVRRYFMTISEAVALVLQAAYRDYGTLCVLDMGEQIRIVELARHMISMVGLVPDVDIPIVYTGLRPGEKLYEELLTEEEESTRKVSDKILVADCPPPPVDLAERIAKLAEAAEAEQPTRVVRLLERLVPSYVAPAESPYAMEMDAETAAKTATPMHKPAPRGKEHRRGDGRTGKGRSPAPRIDH